MHLTFTKELISYTCFNICENNNYKISFVFYLTKFVKISASPFVIN